MKMKSLSVCTAVFVCLAAGSVAAQASATECPAYIPAGVVIRVLPDEKLTAGRSSGPTILTVSSDVRFFPNRPPLLTRGSKVLGTIVESKQAGHFHGKARLRITLGSILNSDFCEYPIDAKIVDAGRQRVEDEVVWGRGHAHRDLIALLFPPTTIYQLVRMPSRGPKLVLDNETPLSIKLLEPVSLGRPSNPVSENDRVGPLPARLEQIERDLSAIKAALSQKVSTFHEEQPAGQVSEACSGEVYRCNPVRTDGESPASGTKLDSLSRQCVPGSDAGPHHATLLWTINDCNSGDRIPAGRCGQPADDRRTKADRCESRPQRCRSRLGYRAGCR
jgi:hypothetical protein